MSHVKQCSKCLTRQALPRHRYCNECHAAYMREWRRKQREKDASFRADFHRLENIVERLRRAS